MRNENDCRRIGRLALMNLDSDNFLELVEEWLEKAESEGIIEDDDESELAIYLNCLG
jgi:hypothetical protein